jgi:hypothetical protein
MPRSRVFAFIATEFRELLAPLTFFFISFNLIELTTQLILAEYAVRLSNFMVATTMALVVGKAVLVANGLPFLRRFDTTPMIRPILFKTAVYWAAVFVARFLEGIIEYAIRGGTISEFPEYLTTHFTWHRFAAIQIWIFVLFVIYTFFTELDVRLGEGALRKMLFSRRLPGPELPHQ